MYLNIYIDAVAVVCTSVSMTSPIIFSCSADLLKRRSPSQTKKPFKTIHKTAKKLLRDFYYRSGQTNHLAARLKFQIYDKLFNGTIFTTAVAPSGVFGAPRSITHDQIPRCLRTHALQIFLQFSAQFCNVQC